MQHNKTSLPVYGVVGKLEFVEQVQQSFHIRIHPESLLQPMEQSARVHSRWSCKRQPTKCRSCSYRITAAHGGRFQPASTCPSLLNWFQSRLVNGKVQRKSCAEKAIQTFSAAGWFPVVRQSSIAHFFSPLHHHAKQRKVANGKPQQPRLTEISLRQVGLAFSSTRSFSFSCRQEEMSLRTETDSTTRSGSIKDLSRIYQPRSRMADDRLGHANWNMNQQIRNRGLLGSWM